MASTATTSDPAPKPHVVMMPFPLQGHITPLMQLAKLLAARGFAISFVSSKFNVRKMSNAKQALVVSDLSKLGIRLVGIADGVLDDAEQLDQKSFLASFAVLQTSFDELVGSCMVQDQLHITCIISDSFLLWTQDVADKWRIPRVSFWPQSLTAFACSISLPKIMAACPNLDPFKDEVFSCEAPRVLDCIPGLDIDTSKLPFLSNEVGAETLRYEVRVQMERVNEPLCIICNTFPALEQDVHTHLKELPLSKPLLTLGPLLPPSSLAGQDGAQDRGTGSSLFDEDQECMHWLDLQRPCSVLYISLGSLAIMQERDVHEIAMGLEACQVPFLWVLRFVTHELALALQKTHGKVISWAPQLRVLSHAAVGGFLTHCGWNSILESLSMGVPMIGWPQMMDQITNCWFQIEKLKVGLRLDVDASNRVRREGVEKAVRILMQGEEGSQMRVHASHISSLVESAFTTSLPSNLDSLVHTILSFNTNLSPQPQSKTIFLPID